MKIKYLLTVFALVLFMSCNAQSEFKSVGVEEFKAYGADCFGDSNTATLTKGKTKLIILLTDDAVSSIQYQAVVE